MYFSTPDSQLKSTFTATNGEFIIPLTPLRDEKLTDLVSITDSMNITMTFRSSDAVLRRGRRQRLVDGSRAEQSWGAVCGEGRL